MKRAILEIAGRDSLAAAFLFMQNEKPEEVFPTFAQAPVEFGKENLNYPLKILKEKWGEKVKIREVQKLTNPRLWSAINGRFISTIIKKYGFYTPCFGCHLYFHLLRIPLARKMNIETIVSGEREEHDKKVKINQIGEALDAYRKILSAVGIKIIYPLRKIKSGREIEKIIGVEWAPEEKQMKCVFSKNYWISRNPEIPENLRAFLNEFLIPAGKEIALSIWEGKENFESIIERHLEKK
jgi:hypothetical protein